MQIETPEQRHHARVWATSRVLSGLLLLLIWWTDPNVVVFTTPVIIEYGFLFGMGSVVLWPMAYFFQCVALALHLVSLDP